MSTAPPRAAPRRFASPDAVVALVTVVGLLLLAKLTLLTPAFTDYEVETDPAVQALLAGRISEAFQLLPLYGGAVLLEFPLAWLTHLAGGGDLAVYRSVAVPGALGTVALAVLGARWLRESGEPGQHRRLEFLAAGLLGLSPCVSLAWNYGHPEEVLVGSAGVLGVILCARGGPRWALAGGAVLGLAIAAKASALVLGPVALACLSGRREILRFVVAGTISGLALLLPVVLPRLTHFSTLITATGSDGVSSRGNLWWFFGPKNPNYSPPGADRQLFTTDNTFRFSPDFIAQHGHELIIVVAALLAAAWWWRVGRHLGGPEHWRERTASVLLLAAAVVWWRGIGDPWFQAYYLTAAVFALVLADARLGRLPVTAMVVWGALWLLHGQNAPDMGLDPDGTSALRIAWLLPAGLWITTRALRPVR